MCPVMEIVKNPGTIHCKHLLYSNIKCKYEKTRPLKTLPVLKVEALRVVAASRPAHADLHDRSEMSRRTL